MFWEKWKKKPANAGPSNPEAEKLPGPRSIEELVGRQMVVDLKLDPDWTWKLRSVVRRRTGGPHRFDFRVFSETQVAAQKMKIKDYTSFDNHPDLILYQGWFDKISMEVHFEENKPMSAPVTVAAEAATAVGATPPAGSEFQILTEQEISQKIIALSGSSSTVFFYLGRGPASVGPLGRGAAIVELNPNYPGKKQKRYIF
ncbi:hypothetical protein KKG19_05920, partial [Patescibacteria group bacterium]|nr:hypothetical protein [Patescibacteria group bacterium]